MNRRRFLVAASVLGVSTVSGCTNLGGDGERGGTDIDEPAGPSTNGGDTSTAAGNGVGEHPATAALDEQPTLGSATETLIVAFEDPSCPACARFEGETLPKIRSNLVEPGKASFVFRGVPIIQPWGESATRLLEATYGADASAFWSLKRHYYAEQDSFDDENVYDRSRAFLGEQTGTDADAVVTAARDGTFDPAVRTDIRAAEKSGIAGTPSFFLFSDGEYRTNVRGAQGYGVFETALGV